MFAQPCGRRDARRDGGRVAGVCRGGACYRGRRIDGVGRGEDGGWDRTAVIRGNCGHMERADWLLKAFREIIIAKVITSMESPDIAAQAARSSIPRGDLHHTATDPLVRIAAIPFTYTGVSSSSLYKSQFPSPSPHLLARSNVNFLAPIRLIFINWQCRPSQLPPLDPLSLPPSRQPTALPPLSPTQYSPTQKPIPYPKPMSPMQPPSCAHLPCFPVPMNQIWSVLPPP